MHKSNIEEEAFHDAGKDDQRFEQLLVGLRGAGLEGGVREGVNEGNQELVFVPNRGNLVIGVENLTLIEAERLHNVLVGVGVNGLFEGLAQQELTALRGGDVPIRAQHNVVGCQAVGRDEEAEVALDEPTLVVGEAIGILPERDVSGHVDFLGHPMVCAAREVLFPGPLVFKGHQLVDVGAAIDDPLVFNTHAALEVGVRDWRGNGTPRQWLCHRGRRFGRDGRRGGVFPVQHIDLTFFIRSVRFGQ